MTGAVEEMRFAAGPGEWRLSRAAPDEDLRGLVVEFWEVQGALAPFRETLLPNGAVELMFDLGPPHRVLSAQGEGWWRDAWFSGLHERALAIESLEGTHLVSARMHPVGAVALLGHRVSALANRIVPIADVCDDAEALRAAVASAASAGERFAAIERALRASRARFRSAPVAVRDAATRIEAAHGNLRIARLHEAIGVSRKHLAVLFRKHVGLTLKDYAKLQRFVFALSWLRGHDAIDWPALAAEAGYSDQSHLARDFRRVGAASPTEYLRRRTPEADALLYDPH
ncbi:MAG TPA: helix-turn-helix domain-containing protein [Xanthomonadales bacterium]|nr:helix-turn-helix domain-containing protein [Xanthomonadales bacterium]